VHYGDCNGQAPPYKLIHCNNDAVVAVINSGYSRDIFMMHLLRYIFFFAAKCDFILTAAHIPERYSTLADALSRHNAPHFLSSHLQANSQPTAVPQSMIEMIPIEKVKQDIQRLDALVLFYFHASLAPSTTRTYGSAKQRYL